jgi:hypothetical protein
MLILVSKSSTVSTLREAEIRLSYLPSGVTLRYIFPTYKS